MTDRYLLQEIGGDTPQCSFCGDRTATGLWSGQIEVAVCPHCATNILPRLMVDAFVDKRREKVYPQVGEALRRAEASAWAAGCCLASFKEA